MTSSVTDQIEELRAKTSYLQVQLEHVEKRVTQLYGENAELRSQLAEMKRLYLVSR